MKEQIFSAKNFQEIFDTENRKGNDIEQRFKALFSESIEIRKKIKTITQRINKERDKIHKSELKEEKKELKRIREESISKILEKIAENVNKPDFSINISNGGIYGKPSYKLENKIENIFLSKQLQQNIYRKYKIRQSSRFEILSLFKNLLEDGFPKYVIRTDIKCFYETITQREVLQKIKEDNLLSLKTQRFVGEILNGYNIITSQTEGFKGVPRGVGISAYLSELYMRSIDNKIKELPDLIFYARYVDDIIAVFTPPKQEKCLLKKYKTGIYSIIEESYLSINEEKTNLIDLFQDLRHINLKDNRCKPIVFLGYTIGSKVVQKQNENNSNGTPIDEYALSIEMSERKLERYKLKIKLAYSDFEKKKKHDRQRAFKLLLARIDYLSSNTKLRNNKSRVFVGIYYSNPLLMNCDSLAQLNRSHKWRVFRLGFSSNEKEQLLKCNFEDGFHKRTFRQLPLVNKIYKNHNGKANQVNNKGILQFGISEITKIWKNAE